MSRSLSSQSSCIFRHVFPLFTPSLPTYHHMTQNAVSTRGLRNLREMKQTFTLTQSRISLVPFPRKYGRRSVATLEQPHGSDLSAMQFTVLVRLRHVNEILHVHICVPKLELSDITDHCLMTKSEKPDCLVNHNLP